jgi:S1-C subfamily serine protease
MELIVMIAADLDSERRIGAGIVVGVSGGRLYIVTANHVVRHGTQQARTLGVTFRSLPGEPAAAKLLSDFDEGLDLAVLAVDSGGLGIKTRSLPFDRLGDANVLYRGDPVYAVGQPNGVRWRVSATPDRMSRKAADSIYFESSSVAPGHSGGGLLNGRWQLVGMIRGDQTPEGEAVRLSRVIERLKEWGYPVNLGRGGSVEGKWAGTVDFGDGKVGTHQYQFVVDGEVRG